MNTAVLLIIFRRADRLRQLVNRLREVKPNRIYVAADGPRSDVPGEAGHCENCRAVIDEIDWPCEVFRRVSETNQGICWGPANAITWFFSHESEGIILGDDVLPDPTFFRFCEELLARYRRVWSVGCICGYNFLPQAGSSSYFFSNLPLIWGWATWRDRWCCFAEVCEHFEQNLAAIKLSAWLSRHDERGIKRKVREAYAEDTTWDFQWMFTLWSKSMLAIVPSRSLTRNIGIGQDATHTHVETPFLLADDGPVEFPLRHPVQVEPSYHIDKALFRSLHHTPTLAERTARVLKSGRPLGRLREIVLRRVRA